MIDVGIVITGGIGVVSTIVSGWTSWFFARKKYNAEVDNSIIDNMKQSLEFYKQLSDDNRERLEDVLKRNELLEEQVEELRKQVFTLMSSICSDLTCQMRKRDWDIVNNKKNGTKVKKSSKEA